MLLKCIILPKVKTNDWEGSWIMDVMCLLFILNCLIKLFYIWIWKLCFHMLIIWPCLCFHRPRLYLIAWCFYLYLIFAVLLHLFLTLISAGAGSFAKHCSWGTVLSCIYLSIYIYIGIAIIIIWTIYDFRLIFLIIALAWFNALSSILFQVYCPFNIFKIDVLLIYNISFKYTRWFDIYI